MQTVRVNLENELRTEDNIKRRDKISSKLKELKEKMQGKSNEINDTLKDALNKDGQINHKDTKEAANDEKEVPNNKEKNKLIQFLSENEEENNNDKSKKKVDECA
jgi:uncharacterized protein YukJ